jgi:hypothetical protein
VRALSVEGNTVKLGSLAPMSMNGITHPASS